MTNTELLPMAAPNFESRSHQTKILSSFQGLLTRCIREGKVVDLENLCITAGEKVWMIFLDLHVLDYDGNLMDAAVLGCVAALMNTKLPTVTVESNEIIIDYDNMIPLPINHKALMCTICKDWW